MADGQHRSEGGVSLWQRGTTASFASLLVGVLAYSILFTSYLFSCFDPIDPSAMLMWTSVFGYEMPIALKICAHPGARVADPPLRQPAGLATASLSDRGAGGPPGIWPGLCKRCWRCIPPTMGSSLGSSCRPT